MNSRLILMALALMVAAGAAGEATLSPATRLMLLQRADAARRAPGNAQCRVIVTMDDNAAIERMRDMGATVEGHAANVAVVSLPVERVEPLAALSGVTHVAVEQTLRPTTQLTRDLCLVDDVHAGEGGLPQSYDGSGIVVGVIDTGFEFNHPAFLDADGNTRLKAVYLPGDTGGEAPVFGETTLPGSHYRTAEQIAALTYDTTSSTHGTHTASTAAGTIISNLGGMAPGADLVLCGLGDRLTDANILNSIYYIASIAEDLDKPYVISISIGSNDGPHNGLSAFNRYVDAVCDDGGHIVISTGNDGYYNMHLTHTFAGEGDQVASILNTTNLSQTGFTAWTPATERPGQGQALQGRLELVDITTGEVLYSTAMVSDYDLVLSAGRTGAYADYYDSDFATYFTEATVAEVFAGEDTGTGTHTVQAILLGALKDEYKTNCRLAMRLEGDEGARVDAWPITSSHQLASLGLEGYVDGDHDICVSDMACGKQSVSVGAYIGTKSYTSTTGRVISTNNYGRTIGDIANFSSYGTDRAGQVHPTVTAPGTVILAAISRYCESAVSDATRYAAVVTDGAGVDHYYGQYTGTSMSTPVVAGIVALMLEAQPSLTAAQIKTVLQQTAITDNYVTAKPERFGAGKVSALDAVLSVAVSTGITEPSNTTSQLIVTGNIVLLPWERARVAVCDLAGRIVATGNAAGGTWTLPTARLAPGHYIITATDGKQRATARICM